MKFYDKIDEMPEISSVYNSLIERVIAHECLICRKVFRGKGGSGG